MQENDKYKQAVHFQSIGDREKAKSLFQELYSTSKNPRIKIKAILGLVALINRVSDNDKYLQLSVEGIEIAKNQNDNESLCYLFATKAQGLVFNLDRLFHKKESILATRGFISFVLEKDKQNFDRICNEIGQLESQIERLFSQALSISQSDNLEQLEAHILMMRGELRTGEYLRCIMSNLKKSKLFRLYNFFGFRKLAFNKAVRIKLNRMIHEGENDFLNAASIFFKSDDELGAAYSYYNFASQLNTTDHFKKASKYNAMAMKIAHQKNDTALIKQSEQLQRSIRLRNKDIPDYIAGETR